MHPPSSPLRGCSALLACAWPSLLPLQALSQTSVGATQQCGGTGGNCVQAGGNGGPCTDSPWPNYACSFPYVCQRDNTYWWSCQLPPSPPPSTPHVPHRPPSPLPPPLPPLACTPSSTLAAGWTDPDTPASACTKSLAQGPCSADKSSPATGMELVFSDEFATAGRAFDYNASDRRWLAVDLYDTYNQNEAAYKPQAVSTRACNATAGESCATPGVLSIALTGQPAGGVDAYAAETFGAQLFNKVYQGGMVQSWNKFCFTGGYVEARIQLPGSPYVGGMWPGFSLMGNLGRMGYLNSTDSMWPYSWDKCYPSNPTGFNTYDDNKGSRHHACDSSPPFGFAAGTARSAPQIDVMQAKTFSSPPGGAVNAHAVGSLQVAPLMPEGLSFNDDATKNYLCFEPSLSASFYDQDCVRPWEGPDSYGPALCMCPRTVGLDSDVCVADHTDPTAYRERPGNINQDGVTGKLPLSQTHFTSFHTYGLWWKPSSTPGAMDGFLRFYVDDVPWYQINEMALQERMDSNGNLIAFERRIPFEPMYLIFDLGLSFEWSWIDPNLLPSLPAELLIDYVRVYQEYGSNHVNTLTCDPPTMPTSQYIVCNPTKFTLNPGDAAMVAAAADYCNTNAEAPSPALPLTLPNPTVTLLPGSQCGGTGGACNRFTCHSPSMLGGCADQAWTGFQCPDDTACTRVSLELWSCVYQRSLPPAGVTSLYRIKFAPIAASSSRRLAQNSSAPYYTDSLNEVWSGSWTSFINTANVTALLSHVSNFTFTPGGAVVPADQFLWDSALEVPSGFTAQFSGFTVGNYYYISLYMVEQLYFSVGERTFSVLANGKDLFGQPIDIYRDSGYRDTLIKGTAWQADALTLSLTFSPIVGIPSVCAIEVTTWFAPPPGKGPPNLALILGLAIGIPCALLLLLILCCWWRRRRAIAAIKLPGEPDKDAAAAAAAAGGWGVMKTFLGGRKDMAPTNGAAKTIPAAPPKSQLAGTKPVAGTPVASPTAAARATPPLAASPRAAMPPLAVTGGGGGAAAGRSSATGLAALSAAAAAQLKGQQGGGGPAAAARSLTSDPGAGPMVGVPVARASLPGTQTAQGPKAGAALPSDDGPTFPTRASPAPAAAAAAVRVSFPGLPPQEQSGQQQAPMRISQQGQGQHQLPTAWKSSGSLPPVQGPLPLAEPHEPLAGAPPPAEGEALHPSGGPTAPPPEGERSDGVKSFAGFPHAERSEGVHSFGTPPPDGERSLEGVLSVAALPENEPSGDYLFGPPLAGGGPRLVPPQGERSEGVRWLGELPPEGERSEGALRSFSGYEHQGGHEGAGEGYGGHGGGYSDAGPEAGAQGHYQAGPEESQGYGGEHGYPQSGPGAANQGYYQHQTGPDEGDVHAYGGQGYQHPAGPAGGGEKEDSMF